MLRPMQLLSMDYFSLPKAGKFKSVLVIVNYFTRYTWAYKFHGEGTGKKTLEALSDIIHHFGHPQLLLSDNGAHLNNTLVNEWCKENSIARRTTPTYSPNSNGLVERANQSILNALERACAAERLGEKGDTAWPNRLEQVIKGMNSRVVTSTGYAPADLMFGYEMTPKYKPGEEEELLQDALEAAMDRRLEAVVTQAEAEARREDALSSLLRNQGVVKERKDAKVHRGTKKAQLVDLKRGDLVLVHASWMNMVLNHKLQQEWVGPYRVVARGSDVRAESGDDQVHESNVTFWLDDPRTGQQVGGRVHANRLKKAVFEAGAVPADLAPLPSLREFFQKWNILEQTDDDEARSNDETEGEAASKQGEGQEMVLQAETAKTDVGKESTSLTGWRRKESTERPDSDLSNHRDYPVPLKGGRRTQNFSPLKLLAAAKSSADRLSTLSRTQLAALTLWKPSKIKSSPLQQPPTCQHPSTSDPGEQFNPRAQSPPNEVQARTRSDRSITWIKRPNRLGGTHSKRQGGEKGVLAIPAKGSGASGSETAEDDNRRGDPDENNTEAHQLTSLQATMSYQDIEDLLPLAFFADRVKPGSSFAQHNTAFGCLPIVGQSQDYAPLAKRIASRSKRHQSIRPTIPNPAQALIIAKARLVIGDYAVTETAEWLEDGKKTAIVPYIVETSAVGHSMREAEELAAAKAVVKHDALIKLLNALYQNVFVRLNLRFWSDLPTYVSVVTLDDVSYRALSQIMDNDVPYGVDFDATESCQDGLAGLVRTKTTAITAQWLSEWGKPAEVHKAITAYRYLVQELTIDTAPGASLLYEHLVERLGTALNDDSDTRGRRERLYEDAVKVKEAANAQLRKLRDTLNEYEANMDRLKQLKEEYDGWRASYEEYEKNVVAYEADQRRMQAESEQQWDTIHRQNVAAALAEGRTPPGEDETIKVVIDGPTFPKPDVVDNRTPPPELNIYDPDAPYTLPAYRAALDLAISYPGFPAHPLPATVEEILRHAGSIENITPNDPNHVQPFRIPFTKSCTKLSAYTNDDLMKTFSSGYSGFAKSFNPWCPLVLMESHNWSAILDGAREVKKANPKLSSFERAIEEMEEKLSATSSMSAQQALNKARKAHEKLWEQLPLQGPQFYDAAGFAINNPTSGKYNWETRPKLGPRPPQQGEVPTSRIQHPHPHHAH
ncbi:hypothetical protein JCM11641_006344 [Rhodosporidiobolus odoratus]